MATKAKTDKQLPRFQERYEKKPAAKKAAKK